MPRIVDHEERRREVTEAAAELVVSRGRAALTVRNVADAVGCSTTVVSHYFADMGELLHATYSSAAERARARLDAVTAADPLDVQALIEALLPMDDERRRDWVIWFAFWSEALVSPSLAEDQRERARVTTDRIARMLTKLRAGGRLSPDCDVPTAARRLGALIPGVAGQALFDPTTWTPARQRAVIAGELALLGFTA